MSAPIAAAQPTARTVLEGVPRIGYDVHLCPFPGSLYAYLQFTGDPTDYDYLMGVTGAAFRRMFNRDDGGNIDLSYFLEQPYQRAFQALGYRWHFVPAEKAAMIAAIRASIDRGKPVISFGIIGPPEAGLVTGYADEGEVLFGWNYFQEGQDGWTDAPKDRSAYYEKRGWFESMDSLPWQGLIVIDERLPERPSQRATLARTLEWAIELARTRRWPQWPDHVAGLAAYDAWADALEIDADYPPEDDKIMGVRCMVYGDQCTMLEERKAAARFLRQIVTAAPESAGALEAAAAAYQAAGEFVSKLWPWGFTGPMDARAGLADPRTRRELAGHVRAAKAKEVEGVAHLEVALSTIR